MVRSPAANDAPGNKAPEDAEEVHEKNSQVNPESTATEVRDAEVQDAETKVEGRKEGAKVVDTELGTSVEEKAAKRAGVREPALDNAKQNREPKNEFEKENQVETDKERKAAQKESRMSADEKEKQATAPQEHGQEDAKRTNEVNQGSALADALNNLASATKKDDENIVISDDKSVTPRFEVGTGADGEVMIRETETNIISKVQFKSLEEKEADLQNENFTPLSEGDSKES